MEIPNTWELYVEAIRLNNELDFQLRMLRIADADHPKCVARDELALFMRDFNAGRRMWADGFSAVQGALDVLEMTR